MVWSTPFAVMGAQVVDFDDLRGPRPEKNQAEFLSKYVADRLEVRDCATSIVESVAEEGILLSRIVSCICVCSILFMCGLLPLRVFHMSWELYVTYFIGFTSLCALEYASNMRSKCFGHESPQYVRFCVWVFGTSVHIWTRYSGVPHRVGLVYSVCWLFACIFHECPRILWFLYARDMPMKAGWAFFAGFALGALPCIVTVLIYVMVWQWTSARPVDMIMVAFLWVLLQIVLKWVGVRIWRLAAPAAPFVAPLLWMLYVELVLGLLGVGIFLSTVESSLAYSLSIGLTLSVHTMRGIFLCRITAPDADGHMLQRVVLLCEMLISLVSRLSMFSLYILNFVVRFVPRRTQVEQAMTSSPRYYPGLFDIFERLNLSVSIGVLHGILGCAISLVITIFYWHMLPYVWKVKCTPHSRQVFPDIVGDQVCRTTQTTDVHSDDVNSSASSNPLGVERYRDTTRSNDGVAGCSSGAIGSGWLNGFSGNRLLFAQTRLLRTFAIEHWRHFVKVYCFTMCLMMLLVSLSQTISLNYSR